MHLKKFKKLARDLCHPVEAWQNRRGFGHSDARVNGLIQRLSAIPEGRDMLVASLAHEARHIRQYVKGYGFTNVFPKAAEMCWLTRVQEADAQAYAIETAWRLKQNGDAAPFAVIRAAGYRDCCNAFEAAVRKNPENLENGVARRMAFDAWFVETGYDLKGYYDKKTRTEGVAFMKNMLRRRPKSHGLKTGLMSARWLAGIGGIDGKNYLKTKGCRRLDDLHYTRGLKLVQTLQNQNTLSKGRNSATP